MTSKDTASAPRRVHGQGSTKKSAEDTKEQRTRNTLSTPALAPSTPAKVRVVESTGAGCHPQLPHEQV